jgi:hypothetical protein
VKVDLSAEYSAHAPPTRAASPLRFLGQRLMELARYRELVRNLIASELKARYKSSVLGFVWSLLNPDLSSTNGCHSLRPSLLPLA